MALLIVFDIFIVPFVETNEMKAEARFHFFHLQHEMAVGFRWYCILFVAYAGT